MSLFLQEDTKIMNLYRHPVQQNHKVYEITHF